MLRFSVLALVVALSVIAVSDAAKLKVKVFIRGEPQKWGQKIVVPYTWQEFVAKSRERLELPVDKFPVIRFYDNEDFEMQNNEEMDNNQHVFVDTSGGAGRALPERRCRGCRPCVLHQPPHWRPRVRQAARGAAAASHRSGGQPAARQNLMIALPP